MAFGIQTEAGGGNFTPVVKINAKQGRVYRVDRKEDAGTWTTEEIEITRDFAFVPDFDNIEIGWMFFKAGQAPDLRMVKIGEALPPRPEGVDAEGKALFKQGFRLKVKLGKTCGGDVRELAATAKSITGPFDKLHDQYMAEAAAHPDQLPQVRMTDMKKVDLKTQHGTNTNFEPVFEITGWVDRAKVFGDVAGDKPAAEEKPAPKPEPKKELVAAGDEEF